MKDWTLSEHLKFLVARHDQDEATVLAETLRRGIDALYEEAMVEEFLMGRVPRETALRELGADRLDEIEYQRNTLRREVAWRVSQGGHISPASFRTCR